MTTTKKYSLWIPRRREHLTFYQLRASSASSAWWRPWASEIVIKCRTSIWIFFVIHVPIHINVWITVSSMTEINWSHVIASTAPVVSFTLILIFLSIFHWISEREKSRNECHDSTDIVRSAFAAFEPIVIKVLCTSRKKSRTIKRRRASE